ncbi:MAG: mechanosensitive ion channel family protein, partial [Candidatus Omnitrophota bacterium]
MNKDLFLKLVSLAEMFMPLIIFILVLFTGLIIRKIIFNRLLRWAKKTSTQLYDIFVGVAKSPLMVLCWILALYFALQFSKLPENIVSVISKSILILGIISAVLAFANLLSGLIKFYSSRSDSALPVTSLTQNIARIFVFSIGGLIILNSLGVSITPILATLGVGGLAVALALQDTLTNLFAGFHITVANQIRVGDYIKLETGEE